MPFGKYLPDQTVGIFVQPSLSGLIQFGKIEFTLQLAGNFGVAGEFLAIIRREGEHLCAQRA